MALRKYFVEAVPVAVLFRGAAGAKHFSQDLVNVIPAIKRAGERAALKKWGRAVLCFRRLTNSPLPDRRYGADRRGRCAQIYRATSDCEREASVGRASCDHSRHQTVRIQ